MWTIDEARAAARRFAALIRAAQETGTDQRLLGPLGEAYRAGLRRCSAIVQLAFWDELGNAEPRVLAFALAALAEVDPTLGDELGGE
jgi:hypothetical protein